MCLFLIFTLLTTNAFTSQTIIIDNDTVQGLQYSNPMNVPYGGYGFTTKLQTGYLGDSRIINIANNGCYC